MTREEIKKQLDEKNIKYDRRFGVAKLIELLNNSNNLTADKIDIETENTALLNNTRQSFINNTIKEIRKNAELAKKIVESKSSKVYYGNKIIYCKVEREKAIEIYEKYTGEFIRVYSLKDHGEDYIKLANMFVDGRNNLK